jgi:hypothetical protein
MRAGQRVVVAVCVMATYAANAGGQGPALSQPAERAGEKGKTEQLSSARRGRSRRKVE